MRQAKLHGCDDSSTLRIHEHPAVHRAPSPPASGLRREVNPARANGLFYGSSDLLVAQIDSHCRRLRLAIVGTFIAIFKIISLFMTVTFSDKNEEIREPGHWRTYGETGL